jgi:hypothetical protein
MHFNHENQDIVRHRKSKAFGLKREESSSTYFFPNRHRNGIPAADSTSSGATGMFAVFESIACNARTLILFLSIFLSFFPILYASKRKIQAAAMIDLQSETKRDISRQYNCSAA